MTIESKDFLQRHPSMPFSSRIMLLWGGARTGPSLRLGSYRASNCHLEINFLVAVFHIGCFSLLFILWNPRGTSFFNLFCEPQLSRNIVLRNPHFIFGKKKELEFKSDRNNCTGLVNFMKNCIELDAVDKWIDLRLPRLGQSYLSLRGQDDEETSFFCLAPISMTIESKDFFATQT